MRHTHHKEIIKYVIRFLNETQKQPSKIAVQKIIFFLKEKGIPLPFEFEAFAYGPFSKSLSFALDELELKEEIKINNNAYSIQQDKPLEVSRADQEQLDDLLNQFAEIIDHTFTFRNIELLGTVLYCYRTLQEFEAAPTQEDVVTDVKSWKGQKFTETEIKNAHAKIIRNFKESSTFC